MTKEQLIHYLKGGIFTGTWMPKRSDTADYHKKGTEIRLWQNMLITPIAPEEYEGTNWEGQYRFSSDSIYGWFPEEDVENLQIVDEYIEFPESTTQHCYRLTYTEEKQLLPNFGKGNFKLPMVVYREYNTNMDDYVKKLSKPQATTIEKRVMDLFDEKTPEWELLKI